MSRFFGLLLTPLLFLPACDDTESTAEEDAEAFVDATLDYAVFVCECSVDAEGGSPEACAEAADDVFDGSVSQCLEDLAATDSRVSEALRCSTTALRDLLDCYESAAICPDITASGSADGEEEPVSDDACDLAFKDALEACGELPESTGDAFEGCFPDDENEAESCNDEEC